MFVDKVGLYVRAGNGGSGVVSFRREKFIDRGGPDGGDGGNGGNIVLIASRNQNTLASFRYKRELKAEDGKSGSKQKKHGKNGKDLIMKVPVGTVLADEEGNIRTDLNEDGQRAIIALGGSGGYGNAHFISSRRRAPRIAEKGEKGEAFAAVFELKVIADVGIVGLPNAGKSTLLRHISNARPQIADYPFTTLRPNLGVVDIDDKTSLLFADVPGLIKGASKGRGLGGEFLRHVERTSVLLHLIDAYEDVPIAYNTIQNELKSYQVNLANRPQVVALNKVEGMDGKARKQKLNQLRNLLPKQTKLFAISALSGETVRELLYSLKDLAHKETQKKAKEEVESIPVLRLSDVEENWRVTREKDRFIVSGKKIERFAARTDFTNPHGIQRLRDIMHKMGISYELTRRGAEPGAAVHIGSSDNPRFTI